MKKLPWVLVIVLLGVIAYLAFRNGDKIEVEQPSEDTPVAPAEESQPQSSGPIFSGEEKKTIKDDSQYLKTNIEYPAFDDEGTSKFIKRFVDDQFANFKTETKIDNLPPEEKQILAETGWKYEFSTTYKIYNSPKVSTVVFSIYTFTGGAHGGLALRSLNFERSEETLTIGDLFKPGSNYLTKLSEISKTKLKAKLGENAGSWIDDGVAPITENFETFYLTDDGNLHIIFQPYQVAPWASGAPEISINIGTELEGIINSEFLAK
jgi:hypothetical protein